MRRSGKVAASLFLAAMLVFTAACPASAGEYVDKMVSTWTRGFTNISTGVLEIPETMKKYHSGETGTKIKGVNYVQGLLHGAFKTLARMGNGAWDMVAGLIPGHQDGMPLTPETLV